MNEIDVSCLPADLPAFIEVDLKGLNVGQSIHVKELPLPKGVTVVAHGGDNRWSFRSLPRRAAATKRLPKRLRLPESSDSEKPPSGREARGGFSFSEHP